MLRSLAPLGALALASCHLVIGLDDFEKVESGSTSPSSTSAGGAGGSGAGGDGGSGGGASPVRWATLFGTSTNTESPAVTPMVALDGGAALLAGAIDAKEQPLFGKPFSASLNHVTVALLSKANGSAPMTDTLTATPLAANMKRGFAVASSPGHVWLAIVGASDSNVPAPLNVYRDTAGATMTEVLSIPGLTNIDDLALAATAQEPNQGGNLYLAFTESSGNRAVLHRYTIGMGGKVAETPAATLVVKASEPSKVDTVVALAASSKAAYLATKCSNGGRGAPTALPLACLYGLPSNVVGEVEFNGTSSSPTGEVVRLRLGCTDMATSPLALTTLGDAPYLALESACAEVQKSPGESSASSVFSNYVAGDDINSFGLLTFAAPTNANSLGTSLASVTSSPPLSRAPNTAISLAASGAGATARLLVAGTVDTFPVNTTVPALMKIDPKTPNTSTALASAKTGSAERQAFLLSLAATLSTIDAKASVTSATSNVTITSVAASGDTVLLGGRVEGELVLGGGTLPPLKGNSGGTPFVTALDAALVDVALD
ncbi:MAG: hypothetical protein FJ095_03230 [Deltaproteobacteria bacterium]|nr:hypothetical protein [Deltaproteobacteria bacterium]